MQMYDYIIADLRLRSAIDLKGRGVAGFKPFEREYDTDIGAECILLYDSALSASAHPSRDVIYTSSFANIDTTCTLYRCDDGYLLMFTRTHDDRTQPTLFHIASTQCLITTNAHGNDSTNVAILRFGLWVMFGIVLSAYDGIAIHSSTIVADGRGVLFLGESGTGKSTHTRLWRENIDGCALLNDDSPIVRITKDGIRVYGSPWSGKTPCYKDHSYPIAGFCRLSQAPHNKIRRLPTIAAIGALLPSSPPAFAHDDKLQDAICATLGFILRHVPTFHLECLPNAEAAQLSFNTIMNHAE